VRPSVTGRNGCRELKARQAELQLAAERSL